MSPAICAAMAVAVLAPAAGTIVMCTVDSSTSSVVTEPAPDAALMRNPMSRPLGPKGTAVMRSARTGFENLRAPVVPLMVAVLCAITSNFARTPPRRFRPVATSTPSAPRVSGVVFVSTVIRGWFPGIGVRVYASRGLNERLIGAPFPSRFGTRLRDRSRRRRRTRSQAALVMM